jgi:carboxypeptidase C (cathepsin A)
MISGMNMRIQSTALAAVLCLALAPLSHAAERPAHPTAAATPDEPGRSDHDQSQTSERGERAKESKLSDNDIATAPIQEIQRVTHHSTTINGRPIAYSAIAGTVTIRDDDGKPTASMFYVAYVADHGPGESHRPLTFFYNGGPGSSSMWLHMGSFAPLRIRTASPEATGPAPYTLAPNNESLLDKTDMVFIDAIGTGFSRPVGDAKGKDFWGVDPDVDAFTKGIVRFLTVHNRWNSPKFLFGESYGTPRSAALVYALQEQNVQVNGVMLLSSILNFNRRAPGMDRGYVDYIPSYAATAWYHNKLQNKSADLPAFLADVRAWADGPYTSALAKGHNISPAEEDAVAKQMSAYTGLSVQYLKEADLRVDLGRFRKELLRDERRTTGRYDSRFEGIDADAAGENAAYDPSDTGIQGAFAASFNDYLLNDLDFHTNLTYRPTYYLIGREWDFKHKAPGSQYPMANADTALDLAAAMRENPHLKVLSLNGWFDMATPFFGTEYDISHMDLDPAIRSNVSFTYYPSGHMVYLNPDALKTMKADLSKFYDSTAGG